MENIEKEIKKHLLNMLENILTQAELKTLAKNKGVSPGKIDSHGLAMLVADTFFITDQIPVLFAGLSEAYKLIIHNLKVHDNPINLETILKFLQDQKDRKSGYFYVAKKEYRGYFSALKENLAVKGLVIIMESSSSSFFFDKSAYERYIFYLPQQISQLIPPFSIQGEKRGEQGKGFSFEQLIKNVLLSSVKLRAPEGVHEQDILNNISWQEGIPHIQEKPVIKVKDLIRTIYALWADKKVVKDGHEDLNIAGILFYLLKGLQEDEWIKYSVLKNLFKEFTRCYDLKKIEKMLSEVCDEAVMLGLLNKTGENADPFYQRAKGGFDLLSDEAVIPSPEQELSRGGISIEKDGAIKVNSAKVSLYSLFEILLISKWGLSAHDLLCSPSLIQCGKLYRLYSDLTKIRLYTFLKDNSPLYKKAFHYVENEFGKFMIHTGLDLFEIEDITISALLKHTFPEDFIPVGENFFALSEKKEDEILRFLEQKKYSIKIKNRAQR